MVDDSFFGSEMKHNMLPKTVYYSLSIFENASQSPCRVHSFEFPKFELEGDFWSGSRLK